MKSILYLAPIRGLTDCIFRSTFCRHFNGFDIAVAPFISTVHKAKIGNSHLKDIIPENNTQMPVIPQIMGNDPEGFINLSKKLFDLGYNTVNWNLGCPFPMVARKKRGSGLLLFPERIDSLLDKVLPMIPNELSIKTRLGRNKKDEIFKLLPIFNKYPLTEIIIHPRTGIQMYKGIVDIDVFEKCISLSKHPVVYNGDINDFNTFTSLSNRFKLIDRWMIGRGALANPFLPHIIKTGKDDIPDKLIKFKTFYDELFNQYDQILSGPTHIVDRMKGFWFYFSRSFKDNKKILKKIHKLDNRKKYIKIVANFFDSDAQWNA